MKKLLGLSLPELMVSIAVVSVVGAGMYVGFQQIDSAQQITRQISDNQANQGLLLDLIQAETARAGQGLEDGRSVCMVSVSGGELINDCDGDSVDTVGQSHGVALCRKTGEDYVTTLFFSSGPKSYVEDVHRDLRCGEDKGPFFDSYSAVSTSSACAIPEVSDLKLRTENLCLLNFNRTPTGVGVVIESAGRLVGQAQGNNFSFSTQGATRAESNAEASSRKLTTEKPYIVSFEQEQFFVASGSTYRPRVFLNRVALERIAIRYRITASDGTETVVTGYIEEGDQSAEIPNNISPDSSIEIIAVGPEGSDGNPIVGETVFVDGIDTFTTPVLTNASQAPTISYVFFDKALGYRQGHVKFRLVADREVPNALNLYLTAGNPSDPDIVLAENSDPNAPAAIKWPNKTTTVPPTTASDARDGSIPIVFPAGAEQDDIWLKPHTVASAIALGNQTIELGFVDPTEMTGVSGNAFNYKTKERSGDIITILAEAQIPEINFLRDESAIFRRTGGESQGTVTLVADPIPETDLNIPLTTNNCGTDSSDRFNIVNASASCDSVDFARGQERATLVVEIGESETDSATDDLSIEITPISGFPGYTVGDSDTHTISVDVETDGSGQDGEYVSYVAFAASSATWTEDVTPENFSTNRTKTVDLVIDPPAPSALTVTISANNVQNVSNSLDWNLTDDFVVSIPRGASSASFDVTYRDDNIGERSTDADSWRFDIDRVVGDAVPGDVASKEITITDMDGCRITGLGGNSALTQGTGSSKDFYGPQAPGNGAYSVSSHPWSSGSANWRSKKFTKATIQISGNYNSTTDRLEIFNGGADQNSHVNIYQYPAKSVAYTSQQTYSINAKYFINQGVMELSSSSNVPTGAWVKFINDNIVFTQEPTDGVLSSTAREVIVNLGDAQFFKDHPDMDLATPILHYYRYVPFTSSTSDHNRKWTTSKTNAENARYFGLAGYLATLTSWGENDFVAQKFNHSGGPPTGWLGGSDATTEGEWYWVTEPDANKRIRFWKEEETWGEYITNRTTGTAAQKRAGYDHDYTHDCVAKTTDWNGPNTNVNSGLPRNDYGYNKSNPGNKRFANWACTTGGTPEPNNAGDEDYLQLTGLATGGGMWNDLPNSTSYSTTNYYRVPGYYVEFSSTMSDRRVTRILEITPSTCSVTKVGP